MAKFRRLQQEEPELLEKLEFVYVLRDNFPECVCMTGGYVPGTHGYTNDQYTYFPVAMTFRDGWRCRKEGNLIGRKL